MLILISPAKTLDYQSPLATTRYTQPELPEHSQQLIGIARKLTAPQIGKLMSISDKLADLNATRFSRLASGLYPAECPSGDTGVQRRRLYRSAGRNL